MKKPGIVISSFMFASLVTATEHCPSWAFDWETERWLESIIDCESHAEPKDVVSAVSRADIHLHLLYRNELFTDTDTGTTVHPSDMATYFNNHQATADNAIAFIAWILPGMQPSHERTTFMRSKLESFPEGIFVIQEIKQNK